MNKRKVMGCGIIDTHRDNECPSMKGLPPEALDQVASYFQALSEPTRLRILNFLREGERSAGELAQLCGYTGANISRHMAMLTARGLVARESRGTSVYFRIADQSVYDLCDLVCGNIARQFERVASERAAFVRTAAQAPAGRVAPRKARAGKPSAA
jgi:DNA-binding transcriptional ArsR family regulator